MSDKTPCGDENNVCNEECTGYGVCLYTKTDDAVLTDKEQIINDAMIRALKETMGIDINAIKKII